MNAQHKEFLDRLEATLKARRVAYRAVVQQKLKGEPCEILERHEEAADAAVMALAAECANMEGAGAGEETELRNAAVDLIKRI